MIASEVHVNLVCPFGSEQKKEVNSSSWAKNEFSLATLTFIDLYEDSDLNNRLSLTLNPVTFLFFEWKML